MAPKYPFVPLSHIHNAITNYTNTAEKLHIHLEKDISLCVVLNSHKVVSIRLFFKLRKKYHNDKCTNEIILGVITKNGKYILIQSDMR